MNNLFVFVAHICTVVILEEATFGKKANKQISLADQSLTRSFHWSRAISKTSFFLVFWIYDPLTIFWFQNNFDKNSHEHFESDNFFSKIFLNCISMGLFQVVKLQNHILIHVFSKKSNFFYDFKMISKSKHIRGFSLIRGLYSEQTNWTKIFQKFWAKVDQKWEKPQFWPKFS